MHPLLNAKKNVLAKQTKTKKNNNIYDINIRYRIYQQTIQTCYNSLQMMWLNSFNKMHAYVAKIILQCHVSLHSPQYTIIVSQMLVWGVGEVPVGDVKSLVRETKLASSCRGKDITVSLLHLQYIYVIVYLQCQTRI